MIQKRLQDTKPAAFNVGDHVRYVGAQPRELLAARGNETNPPTREVILTTGMEGVVLISTGELSAQGNEAPNPWHCRVQFRNGFQFDITPENVGDFELAHGA